MIRHKTGAVCQSHQGRGSYMGEEGRVEFLGCPSTISFSTMGGFGFVVLKVDILAKWLSPAVGGKKTFTPLLSSCGHSVTRCLIFLSPPCSRGLYPLRLSAKRPFLPFSCFHQVVIEVPCVLKLGLLLPGVSHRRGIPKSLQCVRSQR